MLIELPGVVWPEPKKTSRRTKSFIANRSSLTEFKIENLRRSHPKKVNRAEIQPVKKTTLLYRTLAKISNSRLIHSLLAEYGNFKRVNSANQMYFLSEKVFKRIKEK